MTNISIDREKLREQVRLQGPHYRTWMMMRALDLMSDEQIVSTIATFMRLEDVQLDEGAVALSPIEQVRRFHDLSRKRKYYEAFEVNGRNSTEMSDGTTLWIAEFHRLVQLICESKGSVQPGVVREALELLLHLLAKIDDGDVVFFADEAGAWQVQLDWNLLLPVYIEVLAATATPAEYADKVLGVVIFEDLRWDRNRWIEHAIAAGSAEQGEAIREVR